MPCAHDIQNCVYILPLSFEFYRNNHFMSISCVSEHVMCTSLGHIFIPLDPIEKNNVMQIYMSGELIDLFSFALRLKMNIVCKYNIHDTQLSSHSPFSDNLEHFICMN